MKKKSWLANAYKKQQIAPPTALIINNLSKIGWDMYIKSNEKIR
jgi:hypothetical protein